MSVIRFVHTDHLRLGSPLTGLADCPDWLRRSAASAVRVAVANVVEATIASGSHFLLIAGRLTESAQDLDIAVGWLSACLEQLHRNKIRVVLMGHDIVKTPQIRRLDAFVCAPGHALDAWLDADGQLKLQSFDLRTTAGVNSVGGMLKQPVASLRLQMYSNRALAISQTPEDSQFTYRVVPGVTAEPTMLDREVLSKMPSAISGPGRAEQPPGRSEAEQSQLSGESLIVTAGAPQSVGPGEPGRFGCRMVEADMRNRNLSVRFCATDAFRYARESIHCSVPMTAAQLIARLVERSRSVNASDGRTSVVDWVIHGTLQSDIQRIGALDEPALLRELRTQLQAGHAGVWPRRMLYGADTHFVSGSQTSLAVQEFLGVMDEQRTLRPDPERFLHTEVSRDSVSSHAGSATVAGLELLSRVA